jgi:hypothetical protein
MKTHFKTQSRISQRWLFLPVMALSMLACGHLGDRTTVVYGNVYDENQQPVDSIMALMTGSNLSSRSFSPCRLFIAARRRENKFLFSCIFGLSVCRERRLTSVKVSNYSSTSKNSIYEVALSV